MTAWTLVLEPTSAALLGGVGTRSAGVTGASLTWPGPNGKETPALLGSAVKGVLRHDFQRFLDAGGETCRGSDGSSTPCTCPTCRLFGTAETAGVLQVRSTLGEQPTRLTLARVGIDRQRRTVDRAEGRLWSEERVQARFCVRIDAPGAQPADIELFELFLRWCEQIGLHLGRSKTAGAGAFRLSWQRTSTSPKAVPDRSRADPRQLLVRLVALEPVRLAGLRQRSFFREGLDRIPAATLRGALGWALARQVGDDAATLVFGDSAVRVSAGVVGESAPPGRWLGEARCRGPEAHVIDPTLEYIRAALPGYTPPASIGCTLCGAPTKGHPPDSFEPLVLGQTAVDPVRRRAADGMLAFHVTAPPATRFTALVDGPADRLRVLAGLDEVLVGGGRSRGLGRCAIEFVERPPADTNAHLAAVRAALPPDSPPVAVLGLVSDAATPVPLRELLSQRGLEVLAANVRTVLRGGWDERARQPRALRRLLAAGSWVAVTGHDLDGSIPALLDEGFDDPAGTDPLWFTLREVG